MEEIYKNIGERIRETRQKTGMTIEQLATEVDLDWSFVGGIERGRSIPSIETLAKIAGALNVPLSYFFETKKPIIKDYNAKLTRLLSILKNRKPTDIDLISDIAEKIFKKHRS